MLDDNELLRRYVEGRSEVAFAELVRRHVNFVYASALRQVGHQAHLADDVTQKVFTVLARKAALLTGHPVLAGWLFTSTRFAAIKAVRAELRRQAREHQAHTMNELTNDVASETEWQQLRPVLDDALQSLSNHDRETILLRFFEGRTFAEIGARLSVTDDAARLRLDRALEKMRRALARRGLTSTTGALAGALANQVSVAAPASLVSSVIQTSLAGAASGGGANVALQLFFAMNKIQTAIVSAVIVVGLTTAIVELRANRELSAEIDALKIASLNPLPATSQPTAKSDHSDASELLRLRERIAQLKARPDGVVDSAMKSRAEWRNAGRATPAAALETLMWAYSVRDLDAIADSIVYSEPSKRILGAWFAGLSESVRAKFGTPERLLAPLLRAPPGDVTGPVEAYQVIEQREDHGPDAVKIPYWVRLASGEERLGEMGTTEFRNVGGVWKKYAPGPRTEAEWQKMVFSQFDPATGEPLSKSR